MFRDIDLMVGLFRSIYTFIVDIIFQISRPWKFSHQLVMIILELYTSSDMLFMTSDVVFMTSNSWLASSGPYKCSNLKADSGNVWITFLLQWESPNESVVNHLVFYSFFWHVSHDHLTIIMILTWCPFHWLSYVYFRSRPFRLFIKSSVSIQHSRHFLTSTWTGPRGPDQEVVHRWLTWPISCDK